MSDFFKLGGLVSGAVRLGARSAGYLKQVLNDQPISGAESFNSLRTGSGPTRIEPTPVQPEAKTGGFNNVRNGFGPTQINRWFGLDL